MRVQIYDHLPEEAKQIREEVFMEEQGFQIEFDDIDGKATHLVLFDGERPVATCRFFPLDEEGFYSIGRVAVPKEYRGKHLGKETMLAAEECIRKQGGTAVKLSGQLQAAVFYEKLGYTRYGDVYPDEGCPHIALKKTL